MIYRAADKNNDRLDHRAMRRFHSFISRVHLHEIDLIGRQVTWSSEWDWPTLERLDRVFASVEWVDLHPNHCLKPLSSDCSNHCPLLLMDVAPRVKQRFKFESFWAKMLGFLDVVAQAW